MAGHTACLLVHAGLQICEEKAFRMLSTTVVPKINKILKFPLCNFCQGISYESASFKGSAGGECQPFCQYPALCWAAAQHFISV